MKPMIERAHADARAAAAVARIASMDEHAQARGFYRAELRGPVEHLRQRYVEIRDEIAGLLACSILARPVRTVHERLAALKRELDAIPLELKWADDFSNVVCTEGKNAMLTNALKGSAYTAAARIGLIEDAGYTAVAAGNTAANITANASGSPANGWNEAQSSTAASRATPSFGTASGGSLALSAAASFSILATDVIKGAFLLITSAAAVNPTSTVGNTSGALWSAGLFSGGDKSVANGDTLNVSYSTSL